MSPRRMSPRERKGAVTLLYAVAMGLFLCVDWKNCSRHDLVRLGDERGE
jgi:hypothetical protein